jgi:hypothetical protein
MVAGTDGAQPYAIYLTNLESKTSKTHYKTVHMAPRGQTGPYLGQQLFYIQSDFMESCPKGIWK